MIASKYKNRLKFVLFILILSSHVNLFSQVISENEFTQRRENLINMLGTKSAAVLRAANSKVRSSDVNYRYRQESSFLYLTGAKNTNSILLLIPAGVRIGGKDVNVLLFEPSVKNDSIINTSSSITEALLNNNRFYEIFNFILKNIDTLYISSPELSFVNDWINNRPIFIERDSYKLLSQKFPGLKIKSAVSLMSKLREIKSIDEIGIIKKAINITGEGLKKAMKACKPGAWEYELRAAIEYEMLRNGCDYPAFPSIIGSGANSLILHYEDDNMQMDKSQVVVMDVGAEYEGYSADITRTIPVSGKFTPAQKEIYNLVLKAQKEIIKIIKPGIKFRDLDNKAVEVFKSKGLDKYLPHGVSHSVGLDTHDFTSDQVLKTGMIITVEPGLYIPKDASNIGVEYCGFGIRIEDDVLVTGDGCEVLSSNIQKEVKEIEKLMKD